MLIDQLARRSPPIPTKRPRDSGPRQRGHTGCRPPDLEGWLRAGSRTSET